MCERVDLVVEVRDLVWFVEWMVCWREGCGCLYTGKGGEVRELRRNEHLVNARRSGVDGSLY